MSKNAYGSGNRNTERQISFGMPTLVELPRLEDCAALCSELGLAFVEVNMSFPQYQLDGLDGEWMASLAEKYGIYYTVHMDESFDPCHVNPLVRRAYLASAMQTLDLAKRMGIPTLNMHLLRGVYVTLPERKTYVYAENEDYYLARLREFRDAAAERIGDSGIKLCVENTDGYDLPFLLHGMDTLLESPAFALTMDIGHDNAIGGIDKPLILQRGGRLMHMHMHDGAGKKVHLALGDGNMDIPAYLRLAEEHRCRVVLETKTVAALKSSVKYLGLHGTEG